MSTLPRRDGAGPERLVALRDVTRAGLWIWLYALLALQPLLFLLAAPAPAAGFGEELAAALGFLGLSTMTMQFVLTARFQWLQPPFGSDQVYAFHRHSTLVCLALILLHPLVLLGREILGVAGWFAVVGAPWSMGAGVLALYALLALSLTSLLRRQLRLPYDAWRRIHGLLALAAVVLGGWHALASGRLLSRPVVRWMWVGWTLSWLGLILRVRLAKPLALHRRPWVVREVRKEAGGAVTLTLEPEGHEGIRFRSGQFAWLTIFGSPFAATEHPFSFSSSSQLAPRVEFTIKALGDFTLRVQQVEPGTRVYVDGPYGTMSVDAFPDADGYVFVAGGIGIAPCLSMLRTLADRGDRRPHWLFFANVRWEETPCQAALAELELRLDLHLVYVMEEPPPGWTGEIGRVTEELLARHLPSRGRRGCFVCGPARMMDTVERALVRLGVPLGDLHSERFDLV